MIDLNVSPPDINCLVVIFCSTLDVHCKFIGWLSVKTCLISTTAIKHCKKIEKNVW